MDPVGRARGASHRCAFEYARRHNRKKTTCARFAHLKASEPPPLHLTFDKR